MYFGDCRLSKLSSYHDAIIIGIGNSLTIDDIKNETSSSNCSDEIDGEEIDEEVEGGGGEGGVVTAAEEEEAVAALSEILLAAAAATLWMDLGDKRVSGR